MENLNIPPEIITNIKSFIPRDQDMKSKTAELIDSLITKFDYNQEKRFWFFGIPRDLACVEELRESNVSFSEFYFWCHDYGYSEKRSFEEAYDLYCNAIQ